MVSYTFTYTLDSNVFEDSHLELQEVEEDEREKKEEKAVEVRRKTRRTVDCPCSCGLKTLALEEVEG